VEKEEQSPGGGLKASLSVGEGPSSEAVVSYPNVRAPSLEAQTLKVLLGFQESFFVPIEHQVPPAPGPVKGSIPQGVAQEA
jgi:hypothetical protein